MWLPINFWMLDQPFIPRINPNWSWNSVFLIYYWNQFANIWLMIFASICVLILWNNVYKIGSICSLSVWWNSPKKHVGLELLLLFKIFFKGFKIQFNLLSTYRTIHNHFLFDSSYFLRILSASYKLLNLWP